MKVIQLLVFTLDRWPLAVVGAATMIWLFGVPLLPPGFPLCQEPAHNFAVNSDESVMATTYSIDCGAMAGRRTDVALSAWYVDGRKQGDVVVTFYGIRGNHVHLTWRSTRDLLITYPCGTEVEYLVAKEHGVHIEIREDGSTDARSSYPLASVQSVKSVSRAVSTELRRQIQPNVDVLLRRQQRRRHVAHHLQRVRRDLVEGVVRRVVRRVVEVDHVDRVDARIEQRDVIVGDALIRSGC